MTSEQTREAISNILKSLKLFAKSQRNFHKAFIEHVERDRRRHKAVVEFMESEIKMAEEIKERLDHLERGFE